MPKTRHHAYCSARWCSNSGAKGSVKFFRLPKDERCDKWLAYANREDLAGLSREQLNKSHRLCSEHFTDEAYADPQKTKLLREALPSVKVTDERFRFLASEEALQVDDNDSGDLGGCAQEAGSASPTDLDTDAPLEAMRGAEGQNQPQGTGDTPALSSTPTTSIPQGGEQTTGSPSTPQPGPSGSCPLRRGRKRKLFTPQTATIVSKWKGDAQKYRKVLSRTRKQERTRKPTKKAALQTLRSIVSAEFYTLLEGQVLIQGRKKKGRRWPQELREFALSMYFHGPKAYRFLSKVLALPTPRSLRRWLSEVPMTPGIISGVFDVLKDTVKDWPLEDRACIIMFDEMSLRPNLQYDKGNDVVIGFSDDGLERTTEVANTAFVALLSGISKPWVQPLAFAVAKTTLRAEKMRELLQTLIRQLNEIQLYVKAVVCDQGSSNVKLSEQLEVTQEEPFFEVDGHKVYFFFDTPHLIKCTRNNLRAPHKLFIGKEAHPEIVDWQYIRDLYESSNPLRQRLARKLTDDHIYKRPFNSMKVRFATQVLSDTVSLAMLFMISIGALPGTAKSTADFIERMDKLFDCLNSNSSTAVNGKMNYAISANSEHLEFLQEAVKWIASWRFDSPRQPHTIRGWLVTIRAVLMLWEDLSQNFNFTCLLTRHLQQDPLENLFGSLRMKHGSNEHPNVLQFIAALKHVSVGKLFTLTSRGNCEVHDSYMLARLSQGDPAQALDIQEVDVPTGEMSGEDLPDITEENVLYCFAGNLVQQFLKSRPTDCACERLLKERGFFEAVKRWKNVF
ncbi:uncharacterized protein LOC121834216 [Ixodes scapularis]|uniref:uncharacterized protein LOC121834216 n=1 Tax=Ixodes scapularis TaxID=6945 RepID=UPI001C380F1C|nr:uncharacterized protein LOC121834216 [Ixodes scapularis]